jgi:hypothetical protein
MARGRMINNAITRDKKVHDLSCDTSRLGFTWLVSFADKEGRTYGDPVVVRSMVFPRRDDITVEQMESYIAEWAAAGLIEWYEAEGDRWISFPKFDKNQPGLRKDREPDSTIPPPPAAEHDASDPAIIRQDAGSDPEEVRQDAGNDPEEIRPKRREEKGTEDKGTEVPASPSQATPATFQEWQSTLQESNNAPAVLRTMFEALFPGRSPPEFSYLGRTARQVGGAGRLAELMWQASTRPPTGDVLAYCIAMSKGKRASRGNGTDPPRDLQKDIDAVLAAMSSHGRHWSPQFDDPFLQAVADQLDWFELGGMYENAARNLVRDAWFKAREKA